MPEKIKIDKKLENFVYGMRDLLSEAKHLAPHVILANFENAIVALTFDSLEATRKEMEEETKTKKEKKNGPK